jgi:alanyl-tRNA synthetase
VEWVDVAEGGDSEFVGYDVFVSESKIRRYAESEGGLLLVLDKTPFYAESGGQIGDIGTIKGSNVALKVLDVKKDKESFIHICDGELKDLEDTFECSVDIVHRNSVRKNHTATHLMHKALKQVLGDHVNQAGSLVHSDHLRFDLTHFEKISIDEIVEIENRVNEQILINTEVDVTIQGFDDAKNAGAEALFGEKYGDEVRVVKVGDYSMELCGGTHVDRTGDIGSFKITDETSLASGVRRIVAVTGTKAISKMQKNAAILDELQMILNTPPKGMADRIKGLLKDKKELEKRLRSRPNNGLADVNIMEQIEAIGEYGSLVTRSNVPNMDELKSLGDNIFNKLSSGVAVLFSEGEEKPMAVIVVSKDLNGQGILASDIAKTIGGFMGGGGGGKPHLATAGGKDNDAIDDAIISTKEFINEILNR